MVSVRLVEAVHTRAPGRFEVVVLGEEPRPAYDRVRLSSYFETRDPAALSLGDAGWYRDHGATLRAGERVTGLDPAAALVTTATGDTVSFDRLVLATGSAPWLPPIPGVELPGVFVFRTIDDLDAMIGWADRLRATPAAGKPRCAVLGGGLLGLEAARAALDLGLEVHVFELADRLMPRQLDAAGSRLLEAAITQLGITIHLGRAPSALVGGGAVAGLRVGADELPFAMVIVSAGIRPRDELARAAGLAVGPRGGVVVDDALATSDPRIAAIGEVALHRGRLYGLVAPGQAMADVVARQLAGEDARWTGADDAAKLKLLGVDVASFGDPFAGDGAAPDARALMFHDLQRGVYQKLVVSADGQRLLGGVLVGDASRWAELSGLARSAAPLALAPHELLMGRASSGAAALADDAQVCACNGVDAGGVRTAIRAGKLGSLDDIKRTTRAGTGCGGCGPELGRLLAAELTARGEVVRRRICEHFDYTRQELYAIASTLDLRDFDALLAARGTGHGCEVCKPLAASIFASLRPDVILDRNPTIQDTNDKFLANLQRRGLYSVVPRVPGGELTPDQLITLGELARRHGLYTKITGGQRIDMFGARVDQLPDIWEALVAAGFESGHAYGKALRTVKSCVGSSWCRFGVQDSVGLAIRIEHRYKGIRAPHKLKSGVSGCIRECAEAQGKDFGIIATERGYNLYVGGNGGTRPRHAELLATDLDEPALIRLIDRFLVYYIRTADQLTRTSVWIEKLEGGLDHLRAVIVHDSLGIGAELERHMQRLVDGYQCEWAAVVSDPVKRARFRAFANSDAPDDGITWVQERGQARPADWPKPAPPALVPAPTRRVRTPDPAAHWTDVGRVADLPIDGGVAIRHGQVQLALFRHRDGEVYATQNMCPHKQDQLLARGLLGDRAGEPKIACPQHKHSFSLRTGACLTSADLPPLRTFPVRIEAGRVLAHLPPPAALAELCPTQAACAAHAVAM